MILHDVLCMQLHVLELLECVSVLSNFVISASSHLLEPHRLIVVDADVVAAVLHEDVHDVSSSFNISSLESVHGADSIDGTVCHVELASLFVKHCRPVSITRFLIDFAFKCVQINKRWSMINRFIHKSKGLAKLILKHVMLRYEVVKP